MSAGRKSRAGSGQKQTRSFSTSQGRANLARALDTADREKTVVGFARYNTPVAALVPIEAVRMLAGEDDVDVAVRAKITRMAKLFLAGAPPPKRKRSAVKKSAKKAPARGKAGAKAKKAKRGKRKGLSKSA